MTTETLQRLEENTAIKKRYATLGSLGKNNWIAAPVILGLVSLFGIYFFHDLAKLEPVYNNYTITCIIVAILCILAILLIQRAALQATLKQIAHVPACVAKKIYGNEQTGVYYGIYTTGSKRHDIAFIERIAYRIRHIEQEPDTQLRKKVEQLFVPTFAAPGGAAILLPAALAVGEKIYQKQFKLNRQDELFAVLAFHDTNARQVSDADLAEA